MTDITPEEDCGQAFGLVGAAFGIGFILGPVTGGLLRSTVRWSCRLSPRRSRWPTCAGGVRRRLNRSHPSAAPR